MSRVQKPQSVGPSDVDKELKAIWTIINDYFTVQDNESCSTHVHVKWANAKPGTKGQTEEDFEKGFGVDQVRNMIKGIMYFHPAIEKCVPPHRTPPPGPVMPWAQVSSTRRIFDLTYLTIRARTICNEPALPHDRQRMTSPILPP